MSDLSRAEPRDADPKDWTEKLPLTERVAYWKKLAEARSERAAQLEKQLDELQNPPEATEEESRRLREEEAGERRAERDRRDAQAADTELRRARAQATRAIAKLLPEAIRQAKSKPPQASPPPPDPPRHEVANPKTADTVRPRCHLSP